MEFADLGAHCHYDLCQQQTYLPFECDDCHFKFCRFHRTQEDHQCSKLIINNKNIDNTNKDDIKEEIKSTSNSSKQSNKKIKRPFKCSHKGCKKREWMSIICNECNKNYCLKHRSSLDHICIGNKIDKNNKNNNNSMINNTVREKRESFLSRVMDHALNNNNQNKQECSKEIKNKSETNNNNKNILVN